MPYEFRRNTKTIEEINREFISGRLVVDTTYQRRKVWNDEDRIRLIETILLGLVMPEVFFWTANVNADTGETITHIVDGQQRINAIVDYINGDFTLSEKSLLDTESPKKYGGKLFKELSNDDKTAIWQYPISIVDIDRACTKEQIKQMFNRLNLTNYNLNPQEKRNSKDSAFGDKCEALSTLDFWKKNKVFSSTDAKRMKDVEYCCSIYILANEGIIDQTNGKKINDYYDDYKDEFDSNNNLKNRVIKSMSIIEKLCDKTTTSFVSKKAQMYTLFCMSFQMIDQNIDLDNEIFIKFKLFVEAYNKFRNEFVLNYDDPLIADVFENIKKYKLASSEGINKVGNRVIRYEILYKICVVSEPNIKKILQSISDDLEIKLNQRKSSFDELEADDTIDDDV